MKDTFKSPAFAAYCLANSVATIIFFVVLHRSIEAGHWQEYVFAVLLYPAAMFGLGSFFGRLVKTRDYDGEGKAFHLAAFLIVNLIQAAWVFGYAPRNLVWWPAVLSFWGIGLWFHLRSGSTTARTGSARL